MTIIKKIFFFDNIDPIQFSNSILELNIDRTGFIIISKSGSTPETLSQFSSLIEIFESKNRTHELLKDCIIITENKDSPLKHIANKFSCQFLDHEKDIGGRYSVLSSVGLLPACVIGLNISKIREGAWNLVSQLQDNYFKEHLIGAFVATYLQSTQSININALITYSDALYFFGKWYLQLWAESIGKREKGITPIHSIGATDQHSQLQLYLDGPKDKFFTFVTTKHSNLGLKIHKNVLEENDIPYLAGKSMGDLMQAEQQATMDTFNKRGFAYREIYVPKIDEFSIGQLMTLSMLETIASCIFLGVNPFDQPAVEQGKSLTRKYLS